MQQHLRTLTCASLIAFTAMIGVGMPTAVAIRLQFLPAMPFCGAKYWLNQKCAPKQESIEVKAAAEVVVAPTTGQSGMDSPQLLGAEPNGGISAVAALPEEKSGVTDATYGVASAQTGVFESAASVDEKPITTGVEQPEQPLATEKADATSKRVSARPAPQTRRAQAKPHDPRRSSVVARQTLNDVPVNIPDGTQRRIDIRPTSLQDVYYYSARR